MRKFKIVVSDLHLGTGRLNKDGSTNPLEEFVKDRQFVEFLDYYSSGEFYNAEMELVLNGDILDSLQVPLDNYHSPILTESISLKKVQACIDGHSKFFQAIRDFSEKPNHTIRYVVGNHDVDMLWPACKEAFTKAAGCCIEFHHFGFFEDGIFYEHGQQYEAINALNRKKIFLTEGLKEPIINLPWGSHFFLNFIIPIKKERDVIGNVRPIGHFIRWGLWHDTWWMLKTMLRAIFYFIGTRFSKSRYRTSNLVTTIKILKELQAYSPLITKAKEVLAKYPESHTLVMGHTHHPLYYRFEDDREYLNSGTWTEVVSLDLATLGRATRMTYVLVDYSKTKGRPRAYLKEWRGQWHEVEESYLR